MVKMNFLLYLRFGFSVLLIFLVSLSSFSQNDVLMNTIESAKQLRDKGQLEQAAEVLNDYNSKYPGNVWIMQLFAETLYWLNDYKNAELIYEYAIQMYPDNSDIKFEYASMLYDIASYEKANTLLIDYTSNKPDVASAESLLGQISYYLGNFSVSAQHLEKAIELNPADKRAVETLNSVNQIIRPWIKTAFLYSDDSQEISNITAVVEGGDYVSAFFQPTFHSDLQFFSFDSTNNYQLNFLLSEGITLQDMGLSVKLTAGFNYASVTKNQNFLWGVSLSQKINNNLKIQAGAKRSPYTSTLASVYSPFLSNKFDISITYDKQDSWMLKTGYLAEAFSDTNNIQTAYVWGLSPGFNLSVFQFRLGYSFSYSTSKESAYVSKYAIEEITDNFVQDQQIEGVYDPYFTPKQQFNNSVLAILNVYPSKRININLHASVGFYSRTMNPYIYLDKKPSGKVFLVRDFYQESYTPLDMGIKFNYNLSNSVMLDLSYKYLQTFYYNSNNFLIGLRIRF